NSTAVCGVRMNLYQADAVKLLTCLSPVSEAGEMHHAGASGHPHEWKLFMHRIVSRDTEPDRAGQSVWVERVDDELFPVGEGRIGTGDFRVGIENRECAMTGGCKLLVELRSEDLDFATGSQESLSLVARVERLCCL